MFDTGYYFNYGIFVTGTAWCDFKRGKGMRVGLHHGIVRLHRGIAGKYRKNKRQFEEDFDIIVEWR